MSLSTLFSFRKRSLKLTEATTTLKGQYLGNVSTNVAKGEKCTVRPLALLWNNFTKTCGRQTVAMKITVDNSGLKVYTINQGLTHYWCHRISHFCVPKTNPKLFVWIYRHVGKNLKVELRCHAILLTSDKKAKSLVDLLTEKVSASLQEYRREKALKHRRRLIDERAAAHLSGLSPGQGQGQTRTKLLVTSNNYKPPTEYSLTSPTLTAISEEADCSSSEESDYNTGSPYSTLGRWTFRNKFNKSDSGSTTPDVNMNQVIDNGDCDPLDYSAVSGFATLPRHRPNSTRRLQKRLLVDKLETLVMKDLEHAASDSEDGYEVEPGPDNEDDDDSGAGSQSLSGAEASPITVRLSSVDDVQTATSEHNGSLHGSLASLSDDDNPVEKALLTDVQLLPPLVTHIRSFSDGFYSFDKSSLSSECSEVSIERQKIFHSPINYVSSESGVGEEIETTESLCVSETDVTSDADADTRRLPHLAHKSLDKDNLSLAVSSQEIKQERQLFYTPDIKPSSSTHTLAPHINGSQHELEKDFDSDASDSSVEIIRMITRL